MHKTDKLFFKALNADCWVFFPKIIILVGVRMSIYKYLL